MFSQLNYQGQFLKVLHSSTYRFCSHLGELKPLTFGSVVG